MTAAPSAPGCALAVREDGRSVALSGRLDVRAAAPVRAGLAEQLARGQGDLVVDLSALQAVDATGLGLLLGTHRAAGRAERRLVLRDVPPQVVRVLVLSRLDRVLRQETPAPA